MYIAVHRGEGISCQLKIVVKYNHMHICFTIFTYYNKF